MIDFVCMANEGYLRWTELCVQAIRRVHPNSQIHIFDLSEARDSQMRAAFGDAPDLNLTHFPPSEWTWPAWIEEADFDFVAPGFGLRETLKYHGRRLRMLFGARNENWMIDKDAHVRRIRRNLRLFAQKPHVIARALASTARNLVFIDVDAIVLKPLESVFELAFDFAVTAEEPGDVIIGPEPPQCTERPSYPYKAINVGVMFVRNSPAVTPLLRAWIREMDTVRQMSIEQTALANLIYRARPDFFAAHYRPTQVRLDSGAEVLVLSVPMKYYNFTKINASTTGFDPGTFVAHFAGGKKQEQHWHWVRELVSTALV